MGGEDSPLPLIYTQMNKLTVVMWLEMQLKKGIEYNALDPLSYQKSVDNLFEQALAMEKYQIIDAYEIGYDEGLQIITKYDGPLDYFNKTYNNTQS